MPGFINKLGKMVFKEDIDFEKGNRFDDSGDGEELFVTYGINKNGGCFPKHYHQIEVYGNEALRQIILEKLSNLTEEEINRIADYDGETTS